MKPRKAPPALAQNGKAVAPQILGKGSPGVWGWSYCSSLIPTPRHLGPNCLISLGIASNAVANLSNADDGMKDLHGAVCSLVLTDWEYGWRAAEIFDLGRRGQGKRVSGVSMRVRMWVDVSKAIFVSPFPNSTQLHTVMKVVGVIVCRALRLSTNSLSAR